MNCSDSQIPEISQFFNQHDSSLGRHANATSRKGLEIQKLSTTKPRTHLERKFVRTLFFMISCSYTSCSFVV